MLKRNTNSSWTQEARGVNEIQDNKPLQRTPDKVHTPSKSSEFTTIGHVWPRLCGQRAHSRKSWSGGATWPQAAQNMPMGRNPDREKCPSPRVLETRTQHRGEVELWAGTRQQETENSSLQDCPHLRPPGCPKDAQGWWAGEATGGSTCHLLHLSTSHCPERTLVLLMLWGTFRCSPLILRIKHITII